MPPINDRSNAATVKSGSVVSRPETVATEQADFRRGNAVLGAYPVRVGDYLRVGRISGVKRSAGSQRRIIANRRRFAARIGAYLPGNLDGLRSVPLPDASAADRYSSQQNGGKSAQYPTCRTVGSLHKADIHATSPLRERYQHLPTVRIRFRFDR